MEMNTIQKQINTMLNQYNEEKEKQIQDLIKLNEVKEKRLQALIKLDEEKGKRIQDLIKLNEEKEKQLMHLQDLNKQDIKNLLLEFLSSDVLKNCFFDQNDQQSKIPSEEELINLKQELTELKRKYDYICQENRALYKQLNAINNNIQLNKLISKKGYFIDYKLFVYLINVLYQNKLTICADELVKIAQEQDQYKN